MTRLKNDLEKPYLDYVIDETIKWDTAVGNDGMTYTHFSNNRQGIVNSLQSDLLKEVYEFKSYREVLFIKNRNEVPRCISIPTLRDKICLKILHLFLYSNFYREISKQEIPQTHIKKIKQNINRYTHFLKIDIKGFYNSLNHDELEKKLSSKLEEYEVKIIMKAVKNETGVTSLDKGIPQGISISNILADIYMKDFDTHYNKRTDLFYTRYVDDILIFCNEISLEEIIEEVKLKIDDELKLEINTNKEKHGSIKESFDFLGYKTYVDKDNVVKMTIKDAGVQKIEKRLIKLIQVYKYSNKGDVATAKFIHSINLIITGAVTSKLDSMSSSSEKRYGWLFFYSQLDGVSVLYHLDSLIEKKLLRILNKLPDFKKDAVLREVKKFTIAFKELKFNYKDTNYIFRPDNFSLDEKIEFLKKVENYSNRDLYFQEDDSESPEEYKERIEKNFKRHVYNVIRKQEKDIINVIS
ncbi:MULTISPECIES: reverse transcriptase domain-containing protein [Vagococcus]|uniref:Retron-type RNA-directed DNA polymerase n=1 Tax=Vagococcus fluvialis bH819 TaxID=1255619 RepID=A0A1X6WM98_9ENTE|nr:MULTISPECIES: reverse transcriptase domain-containing protein [Vagococcus]SLM85463.1 Retron-type RNA-directed DNA polymerase [Vagococcus fluvialis bH819]HCM89244.1 hypothetical protein [Vagococcus sp.]